MRVQISRCVIEAIQQAADAALPREACGLLFGEGDVVSSVEIAGNVAEDPERAFEIDPHDLFTALKTERAGGRRIMGYWHSHPSGDAMPSQTDAVQAAPDGKLWLILGSEPRLWRARESGSVHGRFDPVEWIVG